MRDDPRARYGDERLPRYTSYPASPHFTPEVQADTYGRWLAALTADASASLYLHVPFCRSMCWYCGCHTTITRHDAPIDGYLSALRREVDLVSARLEHAPLVRHIHFGGGTPTIMAPEAFGDLVALLRSRFPISPDAEIAVEIDPRTLLPEMIAAIGSSGVSRASLGVQSFDPFVQRAIRREQSFERTADSVRSLRAAGVAGINLDLIYGLPHQTVASCIDTVRLCLEMRPDRFAVFGYAHVPTFKKHQRKIDEAALPDGPARQLQADAIAAVLLDAGYIQIGLDHYARPDDAMARALAEGTLHRNFQGYTTDPSDVLLGFGASAIGRLPQGYVQNETAIRSYAEKIGRGELPAIKGYALSSDDRLRADLIEQVMCDFAVDVGQVCREHGRSPGDFLTSLPRLQILEADGLVRIEGEVVSIPDEARILVRSVAAAFDAYLGTSGRTHSRAV
ncbi:oxygen-independent coproporphyrinogen III oxidase [Methylobacterium nigriterrae]|uniref:oxygen-independent coproporphyrinogen III oxidase n=1 Tax=Methylobacterium nigriterrae TaxID=3127512 RepID=UPI003013D9B8